MTDTMRLDLTSAERSLVTHAVQMAMISFGQASSDPTNADRASHAECERTLRGVLGRMTTTGPDIFAAVAEQD